MAKANEQTLSSRRRGAMVKIVFYDELIARDFILIINSSVEAFEVETMAAPAIVAGK